MLTRQERINPGHGRVEPAPIDADLPRQEQTGGLAFAMVSSPITRQAVHSLEVNSEAESLADEYWDYYRATEQLWNIDRGDVDQIEHWEDLSPEGVAVRVRRLEDFARRSEEMAAGVSGPRVRSILAALSFSAGATAVSLPYARDLALVAGSFNFATFVAVLVPGYALTSVDHGRGYIAKLRSLPSFVDGWVAGLREGMASVPARSRAAIASVTISSADA